MLGLRLSMAVAKAGEAALQRSVRCAQGSRRWPGCAPASKTGKTPRKVRRRTRRSSPHPLPSRSSTRFLTTRSMISRIGARLDQTSLTAASGRRLAAMQAGISPTGGRIVANGLAVSTDSACEIPLQEAFLATSVSPLQTCLRSCLSLCLWLRPARALRNRPPPARRDHRRRLTEATLTRVLCPRLSSLPRALPSQALTFRYPWTP